MWTVYIVKCKDKKLYTGITNDLNRRLKEHNSGNGGRFTKFRKPMGVMYLEVIDPNKAFVLNYVSGICILLIAFAIVIFFYKERPLS